jgi:hypothetical protein
MPIIFFLGQQTPCEEHYVEVIKALNSADYKSALKCTTVHWALLKPFTTCYVNLCTAYALAPSLMSIWKNIYTIILIKKKKKR